MNKRKIMVISASRINKTLPFWGYCQNAELSQVCTEREILDVASRQNFDVIVIDHQNHGINAARLYPLLEILQPKAMLWEYVGENNVEEKANVVKGLKQTKGKNWGCFLILNDSRSTFLNNHSSFSGN